MRHVVLVDDQEEVRFAVDAMLRRLGYRVTTYGAAVEVLAHVEGGDGCDVLVTDVVMPGMNGIELARAMRRLRPALPVLFVTGFSPVAVRTGPLRGLLLKPFSLAELSTALERLLVGAGN